MPQKPRLLVNTDMLLNKGQDVKSVLTTSICIVGARLGRVGLGRWNMQSSERLEATGGVVLAPG